MTQSANEAMHRRGGIPRGLAATGPVLFSYGFRPFFLGGAVWACVAMILWILAITGQIEIGGDYGARSWHAHEMLFGFTSAIVAGFLLTAVPNWTGRLPVSGRPLVLLFLLWCAGRAVLLMPDMLGLMPSVMIDGAFLPAMLAVCIREIVAGRKWADLKVSAGLALLSVANACFHYETLSATDTGRPERLAIAALTMMIVVVGGRMLPSFTRNWLSKAGRTALPAPFGRFDLIVIVATIPALGLWILFPEDRVTALVSVAAAVLHIFRLIRWRGWTTLGEPLVAVLHVAYVFVPLGLLAISASALGVLDGTAAMHVLTVGTVGAMMLAVMTRATRGHTGRELTASGLTSVAYLAIVLCALVRPLAGVLPDQAMPIYAAAGALWITAFGCFVAEYGPMLALRRKPSARSS